MATRKPGSNGARSKTGSARPRSIKSSAAKSSQIFPTIEQIRLRAYELYLSRGTNHGDEIEDWLNAERELTELSKARSH